MLTHPGPTTLCPVPCALCSLLRPRADNDDGIAVHGQYSLVVDAKEAASMHGGSRGSAVASSGSEATVSPGTERGAEDTGQGTVQSVKSVPTAPPAAWRPWSGQLWLTHAECESWARSPVVCMWWDRLPLWLCRGCS